MSIVEPARVAVDGGVIEYSDTGGPGPCVVMYGGLAIGPTLWDGVVANLRADHRCIVLTIPWGGHRIPMDRGADLSLRGHARIVTQAISALDIDDVTVVENDTAMTQLMLTEPPSWLRGAVITSCEAFESYPPGLPGAMIGTVGKLPGGVNFVVQQLRMKAVARSPIAFGPMTLMRLPDDLITGWVTHLQGDKEIRRDLTKYLRSVDRTELTRNSERLRDCPIPVLVAWAADDVLISPEQGRRLAAMLPSGRYVEIPDSRTLVPLDQPDLLAEQVRGFIRSI